MLQKVICILFTAAITTIISCGGLPAPVTCQPGYGIYYDIRSEGNCSNLPIKTESECRTAANFNKSEWLESDSPYTRSCSVTGCVWISSGDWGRYHFDSVSTTAPCGKTFRVQTGSKRSCRSRSRGRCRQWKNVKVYRTYKCNCVCSKYTCSPCPIGWSSSGGINAKCLKCEKGKYSNAPGLSTCKGCEPGKYQPSSGEKECKICGRGKYSLHNQTSCTNCPKYTFNDQQGLGGDCKYCPVNPTEGAAACCGPTTYMTSVTDDDQMVCIRCSKPKYCLGGKSCAENHGGVGCGTCAKKFYSLDGDACVPCPKSSYGQWILAFLVLVVCVYMLYKLLKEDFPEEEDMHSDDEDGDEDKPKRQKSIRKFQRGIQKSVIRSTRIQASIQTTASLLAKHCLVFSFTLPKISFIHLPPEIRNAMQSFLSLFTFDLSNFISSPQCDWDLSTRSKHFVKMYWPFICVGFFYCWFHLSKCLSGQKFDSRNFRNRLIGVASFLWITTFFSIYFYQAMTAFICTEQHKLLKIDLSYRCIHPFSEDWRGIPWFSFMILSELGLGCLISYYCGMRKCARNAVGGQMHRCSFQVLFVVIKFSLIFNFGFLLITSYATGHYYLNGQGYLNIKTVNGYDWSFSAIVVTMGCILVSIVHAFDCKIGENLDEYEIQTYCGCPILPHSCKRKMPEWEDPYMCPNFDKAQYVQMVKKPYGKSKPTLGNFFACFVHFGLISFTLPLVFIFILAGKINYDWAFKGAFKVLRKHNMVDEDHVSYFARWNFYLAPGPSVMKQINKPCYDCEYCDKRQRYGWFYDKYHNKCVNYEYIVLLQKIIIALIVLFSDESTNTSLILLVVLNVIFIFVIACYQPYLTDKEFEKVQRVGRTEANVKREQKCSRKAFGVNNTLDIVFLCAVTCMLISELITHDLKQELVLKGTYSLAPVVASSVDYGTNGTNTTIDLAEILGSSQEETSTQRLAKLISKEYPGESNVIAIFEYTGLTLFMGGFLYIFKFIFVFLCGKICWNKKKSNKGNVQKDRAIALTQI